MPHRLLCGEIGRADARFGGAGVVDEHVEPPVLTADPFGGRRDACVARGVDLKEDSPELAGRPPSAFCIARPDKYGVAGLDQSACRLTPESLVRAGDQGNSHSSSFWIARVKRQSPRG
jgi:hypothetical protein